MKRIIYILIALFVVTSCTKDQLISDLPADMNAGSGGDRENEAKGKRGVGFSTGTQNWAKRVVDLKSHWYYSWGSDDVSASVQGAEFVPMIWGRASAQQIREKCLAINGMHLAGKCFYVLGFNEPDLKEESNMSVNEALDLWAVMNETLLPSVKMVSPAPSYPTRQWLIDFVNGAVSRGLRVDHIAVHIYAGTGRQTYETAIREASAKCGNRPVWVTEFAPRDDNAKANGFNSYLMDPTVLNFMKDVVSKYEQMPEVFRYAWFSPGVASVTPQVMIGLITSQMTNNEGTQLTVLGDYYSSVNPNDNVKLPN